MCVLNYDFMILDNGFLVHRPGVKLPRRNKIRDAIAWKQSNFIQSKILNELEILYGKRSECTL